VTATALPAQTAPEEECRRCRAARAIGRILLFAVVGVVAALAISWVTARWPFVGVVLGVLGMVLLVRSLARVFTSRSPVQAATQLGLSLGIGAAVSALVSFLVPLVTR